MCQRTLLTALAILLLASSASAESKCIMKTLEQYPELKPLAAAIKAAKLDSELSNSSNVITLFAPTDVAFQKLGLTLGLNATDILGNPSGLATALAYHLASGRFEFNQLKHGLPIPTLLPGADLVSQVIGQDQFAAGTYLTPEFGTPARITQPNISSEGCQSIIHIVDEFLLANATGPALGVSWA